jgi:hypothetical protein
MLQSTAPKRARTERQQQLIAKYTTKNGMEHIHSIFAIALDFLGVVDDVLNQMSWFNLGWLEPVQHGVSRR